jgi:type II secretory pathway component GspD/PulD (secretin)
MEIVTKLLVADGDIVVIGGIKKNVIANKKKSNSRFRKCASNWKLI